MEKFIEFFSHFENIAFILVYLIVGPFIVSVAFVNIIDSVVKAWKSNHYKTKLKSIYYFFLGVFIFLALIRILVF